MQKHCDAFFDALTNDAKILYMAHRIVYVIARKVNIMMLGIGVG